MENFGTVANVSVTVGSITSATMYCCVAQSLSSTDHRFTSMACRGERHQYGQPGRCIQQDRIGGVLVGRIGAPAKKKHNGGLLFGAAGSEALTDPRRWKSPRTPASWEMFAPTRKWVPVSVGGGVSGSIAATESGSDTSASTGKDHRCRITGRNGIRERHVRRQRSTLGGIIGTMAATESGSDTYSHRPARSSSPGRWSLRNPDRMPSRSPAKCSCRAQSPRSSRLRTTLLPMVTCWSADHWPQRNQERHVRRQREHAWRHHRHHGGNRSGR